MAGFVRQILFLGGGRKNGSSTQNSQSSSLQSCRTLCQSATIQKPWANVSMILDNINRSNTSLLEVTRRHLEYTWPHGPRRELEIVKEMENQLKDIRAIFGDIIEYGISNWVKENVLSDSDYGEVISRMVDNVIYSKRLFRLKDKQFSTVDDVKWKSLSTFEESYDEVKIQAWVKENHFNTTYLGPGHSVASVIDSITDIDYLEHLYNTLDAKFVSKDTTDEIWIAKKLENSEDIKALIHQAIMTALGEPNIVETASRGVWLDKISERIKSLLTIQQWSNKVAPPSPILHPLPSSRPLSEASTITDDDITLVDSNSETKSIKSYKSLRSTSSLETIKVNNSSPSIQTTPQTPHSTPLYPPQSQKSYILYLQRLLKSMSRSERQRRKEIEREIQYLEELDDQCYMNFLATGSMVPGCRNTQ